MPVSQNLTQIPHLQEKTFLGSDVIICGTWDGTIRGFHPEGVPYAAEHLLFERALDAAVLQIETGNFLL